MKSSIKSFMRKVLIKKKNQREINIFSYENRFLTNYIIDKTENYLMNFEIERKLRTSDISTLLVHSLCVSKSNLVILDFGGGAGIHHGIFKRIFPELKVNWLIVENPTMKELAENRMRDIHYFADLKEVYKLYSKVDIIFANSSLQYVSEPLAVIDQLLEFSPEVFFIVRTAMHSRLSFNSVQISKLESNGPGISNGSIDEVQISYPITVLRESEYLERFAKYELIFRIDDGILSGIKGQYSTCNLNTLVFRISNQEGRANKN